MFLTCLLALAAATICSASATVFAKGFSQITCLPALSAAIAISACESPGVQISMMSISERVNNFFQSVSIPSQPRRSAAS